MNKPRSKPLVVIQSYEDRNSGKEAGQATTATTTTVSERLLSLNHREASQEKSSTPVVSRKGSNASVLSPPPPPPLPPEEADEVDNRSIKSPVAMKQQKIKAPPPPVPQKTSNSSNQPPPCPPPDYDTLSISSTTSTLPRKSPPMNGYIKKDLRQSLSHNGDAVEMESLESYKLHQQNDVKPKSPNTYFRPKSNGSAAPIQNGTVSNGTLTKQQRPVSVIIGEYPSGTSRKQPKKLDFLNSSRESAYRSPNSDSIVSQFASELAQTLNRSNLRKKTESMENLLNHPQIKANSNGSVRISVNSNLSKHLAKSTNDLLSLDSFSKTLSNRVTISIPSNDKKTETPSGILKHNSGNHNLPSHRSVLHQKSITFGEIPTVINDQPLHVT